MELIKEAAAMVDGMGLLYTQEERNRLIAGVMSDLATIEIEVKSVFGKATIYPANEAAELLAKIAGTVTLTNQTLGLAERMGFTIKEVFKSQTRYAA